MPDTTSSLFTGPVFEILAGFQYESFVAHGNVLAKSNKLKAMMEAEWKDSRDRIIVLIDWDDETVGRLLEWLYTDDYSSPDPGVTQVIPSPTSQQRTAKSGSLDPQDEQQPRQTSSDSSDSSTKSEDVFTIMNASEKPKANNSTVP